MANTPDAIYTHDGSFSWAGGVDSSLSTTIQSMLNPDGLPRNELAWLNNATVRGGSITQRAGWQPLVKLPQGYWQGHFIYESDAGFPYLVCVISGVVYRVDLQPPYAVTDLTGGDPNLLIPSAPIRTEMCYFCQAEFYLVIQAGDFFSPGTVNPPLTDSAGRTLPLFWDGTTLRRSVGIIGPVNIPGTGHIPLNEIPAATAMDYYENRLWYAQGRQYSAGDIVGDQASGDPTIGYRDSVLKVTENPLALGGDGFTLPTQAGNIRSIVHASQLNASLGQGSLYVGTRKAIYNPQVPITRTDWIGADASNMPSQPIVQLVNGPCSHRSIIPINGDLYYQSFDPAVRSLIRAVQYFAQPGNTAISQNVNRALKYTDRSLMHFASSIYFDSRFLTLTIPKVGTDGVNIIHQAILALDFDVVTNLSGRNNAVWEGAYDGLQFIELISVDYNGLPRAMAAIVSDVDDTMQLWELTNDSKTDNGDNRVTWSAEFPAYTWAPGGYETELKQLSGGELWVDRVSGTVQLDVYYRPDGDPCWRKWFNTNFCAARNQDIGLGSESYPCEPLNEGAMYPIVFPEPCGNDCDAMGVRPTTIAYQFQVKVVLKGFCRIRGMILDAQHRIKAQYQGLDVTSCRSGVRGAMATLPFTEQPLVMPVCVPPGAAVTFPPSEVTPKDSFTCSILTVSPLPVGNELSPYSLQIQVQADLLGWTAAITLGSLPPGLTMTDGGNITGMPTTVGTYSFRLTVTKTTFMTCYQDFTLVISAPICAITSDSTLQSGTVGIAYSNQLAVDAAVTVTGWSVTNGALPTGLTINATGLLSGTPTSVEAKTLTITVSGADGLTCSKVFTLNTVAAPNCSITSNSPLPEGTVGMAYLTQLTVSAALTVTGWSVTGTLPSGLAMDATGLISGVPTAVQTGTFTVTVTGTEGMTCSKDFSLTTSAPPVCSITTYSPLPVGTVGIAYSPIQLTVVSAFSVTGWAITSGTLPTGMSMNNTGLITGTPTSAQTRWFTVTVTGAGGMTCSKEFNLNTSAAPTCSITSNSPLPDGTVNTHYSTQITVAAGAYVTGWAITGGTLPTGLSMNSTGLISGTPTSDQTSSFTVTVTGVSGMHCSKVFTITTSGVPVNITLPIITGTLQVGQILSGSNGTWTNCSPSCTYKYRWLANGFSISTSNALTLQSSQVGQSITFEVTAHNTAGDSIPATKTIAGVVSNPPNKPVNVSPFNGQTIVSSLVSVQFHAGAGSGSPTTSYDVYLYGNYITNTTNSFYTFGPLGAGQGYLWYVVARNSAGDSTQGDTWGFNT